MMNMAYCRFENTLEALRECYNALHDELSPTEHKARNHLVALCQRIVDDFDTGDDPEVSYDEPEDLRILARALRS